MPAYGYSQDDLRTLRETGVDPHQVQTSKSLQLKVEAIENHLVNTLQLLLEVEQPARELDGNDCCGYLGKAYIAMSKGHEHLLNAQLAALGERVHAPKLSDTL